MEKTIRNTCLPQWRNSFIKLYKSFHWTKSFPAEPQSTFTSKIMSNQWSNPSTNGSKQSSLTWAESKPNFSPKTYQQTSHSNKHISKKSTTLSSTNESLIFTKAEDSNCYKTFKNLMETSSLTSVNNLKPLLINFWHQQIPLIAKPYFLQFNMLSMLVACPFWITKLKC
jgi:hypothetical protein